MSQDVVPQVDIGALTLRGLNAFTPLLAALTADNVTPTAMIQLENLGALFHVNGPYAAKAPDLLRRSTSVHMDQIGMSIGWRKGDTASIMAQSTSGQAVALLCFCLANICHKRDLGSVLYDLCEVALPGLPVHCSARQLEDAAELLAFKLQVLGFGNTLAEQAVKIHDVYVQLGLRVPRCFFDFLTCESVVCLLHSVSKVFADRDTLLRITGTHTMGHIVTVLLILFPDNVMLTIEDLLVREGPHVSIIIEVSSSPAQGQPTTIQIERRFDGFSEGSLPLGVLIWHASSPYTFKWSGHIADALGVEFVNAGLSCPKDLRKVCCDLLVSFLPHIGSETSVRTFRSVGSPPLNDLLRLLGTNSVQDAFRVSSELFRTDRPEILENVAAAYTKLVDSFEAALGAGISCTCPLTHKCDLSQGWPEAVMSSGRSPICVLSRLWYSVGMALERGWSCLLIDAQSNSTCTFDMDYTRRYIYGPVGYALGLLTVNRSIKIGLHHQREDYNPFCLSKVHQIVMQSMGNYAGSYDVAVSNGGCTLLPALLSDLQLDTERGFRYRLYDGQLFINGIHHTHLCIRFSGNKRSSASEPLLTHKGIIQPSSIGVHTRLSFTVREYDRSPELRTTMLVQGQNVHLDLGDILVGAMDVHDAPACEHDPYCGLNPDLQSGVLTISVASAGAEDKTKIAIVQTMDNPVAQVLACSAETRSVLQRHSCLDCAVRYAREIDARKVIVGDLRSRRRK